jgi:hypothetical protein
MLQRLLFFGRAVRRYSLTAHYSRIMEFTRKAIEKFKHLYFQHFGEEISDEEVRTKAEYLIEIYRVAFGMPDLAESFTKETVAE